MAQITVDQASWDALSQADKDKIVHGLKSVGSLDEGDTIVGAADFEPAPAWDPIKELCRIACDTAAGAAVAWCTANTGGAATAVCIAAAEAARQKCRERC